MVRLFLLLLALLMPALAHAQSGQRNMTVGLVAESATPAPGAHVTLAITMTPRPGWHGYWQNPGDAGAAPRVIWNLPPGVEPGPLQYPVPGRLVVAGLMNYVYKGPYAHLVPLRIPEGMAPGTSLPVRARIDYLVCSDELCVPEQAEVATRLTVGDGTVEAATAARFDTWRAALPRPLGVQARFSLGDGRLRMAVPVPASTLLDEPYLFPVTEDVADASADQQLSRHGDLLIIETAAERSAAVPERLDAVLRTGDGQGLSLVARPGQVPPAGTPITAERANGLDTFLAALAGAVLGGLLLNIMPCVFPILSLKALSLARAGETQRQARREALAYAGGVILTCLALGGLILAVRAGGEAVGWAFQLQDPRVIVLLLLLTTAIALSLAGLFHVPALSGGQSLVEGGGPRGAFWTGALAAFVATPCTGPFMGFALGAALVLPPAAALAVFAGLGLGLALPFLLVGFVPALRRRLPRPGPWMGRLQRLLSIPMFLTALGLAWILGRQSGVDGMAVGLGAALVLGLGLWWLGRRQGGAAPLWPPLLPTGAAVAAGLLLVPLSPPAASAAVQADLLGEQPFDEARLQQLRAAGTPVFLYFTADWCITCKVNEQGALKRQEVADAFRASGTQVLVGDWTRADPAIGRFLERHGRSGVPLYLYYPRGGGEPEVLPQLLTVGRLTALGA